MRFGVELCVNILTLVTWYGFAENFGGFYDHLVLVRTPVFTIHSWRVRHGWE